MKEIWAPQVFVIVFLALPLLKPYIKAFRLLDGLVWLPLLAVIITVLIFPAYGFRPELLPVLFVGFLINAAHLVSRLIDSRYSRSPVLTIVLLVFLTAAVIPMFAFSSRAYSEAEENARAAITLNVGNTDKDYVLRIYEAGQPDTFSAIPKPVVFIIPPELGSAASVDLICRELRGKGYTVVTYSRRGLDAPLGHWRIFRRGTDLYSVNERGKNLEAERKADIEFLLPLLPSSLGAAGRGEAPPLLLAGYGAGGSALAYLAGENDFASRYGKVLGVIAIECRLWSSYRKKDPHESDIPVSAGKVRYQWGLFTNRLRNIGPQRVIRMGPLPGMNIPIMYLLSGRALDAPKGQLPYEAIFDALRSSSGPVTLAAVESAGPLDYQDFPYTYPVYSFLLPGLKDAQKSENPIADTAGIIGNFAVYLLERAGAAETGTLPRQTIEAPVYLESKGLPGFRL